MSDAKLEREAVHLAERVRLFFATADQSGSAERIERAIGFSRHAPVVVVVAGARASGKSSLLNALLGETDLLPVGNWSTTSKCWTIRYGDQRASFGSETEQEGPSANVVQVPSPLLSRGLTLIDTPGIGGSEDSAAIVTRVVRDDADVVLYTVDSTSPISQEQVAFLREATGSTGLVIFTLTKIDSEPMWEQSLAQHKNALAMMVPASVRIHALAVSSTWHDQVAELRIRGEDAAADRCAEGCGFGNLEALIDHLVDHRRWLRGRALMHECHELLIAAGHSLDAGLPDPNSANDDKVEELRNQLAQLREFKTQGDLVLAGFRDELAELSAEIRQVIERKQLELEKHLRRIDVTAVSAQEALGHDLNAFLDKVERRLDGLVAEYQRRAAKQVLEALRGQGFQLMAATYDPAIRQPDTSGAKIDPRLAPLEVSAADALVGAVRIAERALLGQSGDNPSATVAVVRRSAAAALGRALGATAGAGFIGFTIAALAGGIIFRAGQKEAGRERIRIALRRMVEEAAYSLSGYPGVYQDEIDRYDKLMWKELRKVAKRLAEELAERLVYAEKAQAENAHWRAERRLTAALTQLNTEQLLNDVEHVIARFDREEE